MRAVDPPGRLRGERKRPAPQRLGQFDSWDADEPQHCEIRSQLPSTPVHDNNNNNNNLTPNNDETPCRSKYNLMQENMRAAEALSKPVISRRSSIKSDSARNSSWFLSWMRKVDKERNSTAAASTTTTSRLQRSTHNHRYLYYLLWIIQMLGTALAENEDEDHNENNDNDANEAEENNNQDGEENGDAEGDGENADGVDDDGNGINNDNGNYIPYSTDKHWSYSHSINPYGYLDVHDSCMNQPQTNNHGILITISSIHLVCDSPGAYYKGSTAYRNSATCMTGDTAKLTIDLTVSGETNSEYYRNNFDSIRLSLDSGVYNHFQSVYAGTMFCTYQITPEDSGTICPSPGRYKLEMNYVVPDSVLENDFEVMSYTPEVRLTFKNAYTGDFAGCATAGAAGYSKTRERKAQEGMIILAIAVVAFSIIFSALLYLSHRRRKRLERLAEQNKSQRFQYFGTLPNGQVVPFPAPPQDHAPDEQFEYGEHPHPHPQNHMQQMQHLEHIRRLEEHQMQMQHYRMQQQQQQQQQQLQHGEAYGQGPHEHNLQHTHSLESDSSYHPTPGGHEQHGPPEGLQMMSNPQYNETHLPTRPII